MAPASSHNVGDLPVQPKADVTASSTPGYVTLVPDVRSLTAYATHLLQTRVQSGIQRGGATAAGRRTQHATMASRCRLPI